MLVGNTGWPVKNLCWGMPLVVCWGCCGLEAWLANKTAAEYCCLLVAVVGNLVGQEKKLGWGKPLVVV